MTITIQDQTLELLPEKAALLPDGTLLVADIHLGKATAFQAKGLAIPEGDSAADLQKLAELCRRTQARQLVINGDLFHSAAGLTPEIEHLLESNLFTLGIPVQLVIGNHDQKLSRLPGNLHSVPAAECAGFQIVHEPADAPGDRPVICAHWHPVARIADGKRTSLRLPCFLLRGEMLVLPSFGTFTGGSIIDRQQGDRVFVAPGDRVIEVPAGLLKR